MAAVVKYILDDKHNIIPCLDNVRWTEFMKDIKGRTVNKTQVGENEISTVFLGISFGGLPILFETMIFGPYDPDCDFQKRYYTWREAELDHQRVVKMVQDAQH